MKRILTLSSLLAIALATIGCGFFSATPDHAQFIEEDAWLVVTVRPGQIMEKLDYESLVQSFLDSEFDKEVALAMNILNLDEPEKTGVNLDEPIYFFMKGNPDNRLTLQAGVSFALSEVKDFDDLVDTAINFAKREGEDLTLKQDEDLRIVTFENSKLPVHLLYDEDKAFLAVGYHNPKRKFLEPEGLDDHSPVVQAHLERSFDLGAVMDFSNFTSAMRSSDDRDMETIAAIYSSFDGGGVAYELSAEDGELLLKTFSSIGTTSLAEDVVADSVDSDLLEVIPDDSIAAATLSMNLNAAVDAFLPTFTEIAALGNNGELPADFPRDLEDKLPNVGFSLDDLTTAIPGEFSAALIELNGNDAPEFVVAIKTADLDSAAYKKVISNNPMIGMLKENLQEEGIRFEEKDNLILLASAGQSSILRNAAATDPVSGDKEDVLGDGYAGLWLDFDELLKNLPAPRGDDDKLLMKALRKLDLLSMEAEVDDEVFISSFKITFKDDDANALRQIAESIEEIIRHQINQRKRWEEEYFESGGDSNTSE